VSEPFIITRYALRLVLFVFREVYLPFSFLRIFGFLLNFRDTIMAVTSASPIMGSRRHKRSSLPRSAPDRDDQLLN
jgi:hypothetical protein